MSTSRKLVAAIAFWCAALGAGQAAAPGDLDPSFNAGGYKTVPFDLLGGSYADHPKDMMIDAASGITAVGWATTASGSVMALVALQANGFIDGSQFPSGKWTHTVGAGAVMYANAVTLTSLGPCLAGRSEGGGAHTACATPPDGVETYSEGPGIFEWAAATPARVTPMGDVFEIAGRTGASDESDANDFYIARMIRTAQGVSPDASFGVAGYVTVPVEPLLSDSAFAIEPAPDGGTYVAGEKATATGPRDFAVVKLTSAGVPDANFGNGGVVTIAFDLPGSSGHDNAYALAVDNEQRIVVAGVASAANFATDVALVRLFDNGTPDSSFGPGGRRVHSFSTPGVGAYERVRDVAIDPSGRIYVLGTVNADPGLPPQSNVALIRLSESGSLDTSFGTAGKAFYDFSSPNSERNDIGVAMGFQDDRLVILAERQHSGADTDFVIFRILPDGDSLFANGFE
jgi:uncharacterized delta-60 repeat protein